MDFIIEPEQDGSGITGRIPPWGVCPLVYPGEPICILNNNG
jgi:hypothetical protein